MSLYCRKEIIGDCTLYLGDCLDIMPALGGISHVISDPPYENELHEAIGRIRRNDGRQMISSLGFGGINAIRAKVAKNCVRLSSGWLLLFTLAEGVRAWRDCIQEAGGKWDTTLAWVKPDAAPRFNGQGAARGFECVVSAWCGKGYRKWNGGGRRGVFVYNVNGDRPGGHPTEKPIRLMSELVALYSMSGETILDPFMGSGTTGVASMKLRRKFVGIEINQKYFDTACQRIADAGRQLELFDAPDAPRQQSLLLEERSDAL